MAFDKTKPAGTTPLKQSDDQIRDNWDALESALNQDHDFATGSTQTGKHKQVIFKTPLSAKPSLSTDEAALYTKSVSAKSELFFEDEDGNEIQFTNAGRLWLYAGTTKCQLRVIDVTVAYYNTSYVKITIGSVLNGNTLSATSVSRTSFSYSLSVTGNALAVLGVSLVDVDNLADDVIPYVKPWASINLGKVELGIAIGDLTSQYFTFGDLIASDGMVRFTVAYLTSE